MLSIPYQLIEAHAVSKSIQLAHKELTVDKTNGLVLLKVGIRLVTLLTFSDPTVKPITITKFASP